MKKLGLLDRYIGALFVRSYGTAFFLVVGLFLILDMSANLDDYLAEDENGAAPSALMVARFYLFQLPFLYLEVSPFVTLVAGLFTASRLARHNEVVAALGAGVSARRILAPVVSGAILLALGMFALRELATDTLASQRDSLHDRLTERRDVPIYEGFWVKDGSGRSVRIHAYLPGDEELGRPPEIRRLASTYRDHAAQRSISLEASGATWDAQLGRWQAQDAVRLVMDPHTQTKEELDHLGDLAFTPADVELAWKGRERPGELAFSDCLRLLERDPENPAVRTVLHAHMTFPLAGLVLLTVGLPFLVSQERGRAVERVAVGFLLCVGYFGLDFVTRTLGLQGHLGPVYAGWLPVLFFGSLGTVLWTSMRS